MSAAAELGGIDGALLKVRRDLRGLRPESKDWPAEVSELVADRMNERPSVQRVADALAGAGAFSLSEEDDLGAYPAPRYLDHLGRAPALGYGDAGTIPVVTAQHRSLLDDGKVIRPAAAWGRPQFEWAYRLLPPPSLPGRLIDVEIARDEVLSSWVARVFQPAPCWTIERLQVCVDRIEPTEIVSVAEVDAVVEANVRYGPKQLNSATT